LVYQRAFFMPVNHVLNGYTFRKFCPCDNHKKDGLLLWITQNNAVRTGCLIIELYC